MATKQELLSKFALQAGAELPGFQSNSSQIQIETETSRLATSSAESKNAQDEELFKDSFADRTKVPPWQHPKYKILIVSLCIVPAALAVGLVFKNGVPKPKLGTRAINSAPVAQDPDDLPKPATDGEWASYASTNGMRQQFADAAQDENTDALKKIQEQANSQKPVPDSSTDRSNIRSVPTAPATRNNISSGGATTYSYARTYTAPAPPPVSTTPVRIRTVAPAVRSPKSPSFPKRSPVSTDSSEQSRKPTPEMSPQERVSAILAATSTEDSSDRSTDAAGDNSTQSESFLSDASRLPLPQATAMVGGNSTQSGSLLSDASRSPLPQATAALGPVSYLPSEAAVIDGQPQILIARNLSAKGRLLTGIAFTAGDYASLANQPIEIELSQALGAIPAGTRIIAVVDTKEDRSSYGKSKIVRLRAVALAVGDLKMPLSHRAISLSGKNGDPLMAKKGGRKFFEVLGGVVGTVAGGATITNFGAAQNVQIGDSSYFKSIGANIATNLISNAAQQLQRSENSYDRVLTLKAGTTIMISVRDPIALPAIAMRKQVNLGDAADEAQN